MRRRFIVLALGVGVLAGCARPAEPVQQRVAAAPPSSIRAQLSANRASTDTPPLVATATTATAPFRVATYLGQPLPTPTGDIVALPPAWLIVGDQVIPATFGSANGMDQAPPEDLDDVAVVQLPADAAPILVIGAGPIHEIQAGIRPWGKYPYTMLTTTPDPVQPTVFTLEPLGVIEDQVLGVYVFIPHTNGVGAAGTFSGDVNYTWRLNPPSK